jgi:hypothetical protein
MAKNEMIFQSSENAELIDQFSFCGMPTYQLGAKYPNDFIGHLDDAHLPRPADLSVSYFMGFYVLLF